MTISAAKRSKLISGFSDFEKSVYSLVMKIPRGETRSYKWVAQRIGRSYSYRAVGNALHKNPHPGLIPCHRVIREDGSIGGFSSGPGKKKMLLAKERAIKKKG